MSNYQKAPEKKVRHGRTGAFSASLIALAIAVVILFNLLAARIPDSVAQFDLTGSGIYDITETSKNYLSALTEEVEIQVLASEDSVDSRIVRFLKLYAALSDHLTVTYTDPNVYPSILTTYGVDTNTIVVTCEATGLQESFAISDIIGYDIMSYYYYGTYEETDFDAEGLLTSAVDSVVTGSSRTVYQTTDHNETELPDSIIERFKKAHLAVESISLLMTGGVPEDCDLLVINAPTRDLADDELTMLEDYLSGGGQVIYCMAGQDATLPNFETFCADYGLTVQAGLVADLERYYQNNPYLFFPVLDTSADAAGSLTSDSLFLFYSARGMLLSDPQRDSITVSPFLTTSDNAVAVVSEVNQVSGSYVLGAVATEEIDENTTARLTVFGSDSLVNANILSSFSNLDNADLFLSAATCAFDDISTISIEPVNLETPTNTITTGGLWSILFTLVIPGGLLLLGFVRWFQRQKL